MFRFVHKTRFLTFKALLYLLERHKIYYPGGYVPLLHLMYGLRFKTKKFFLLSMAPTTDDKVLRNLFSGHGRVKVSLKWRASRLTSNLE